MRDDYFRLWSYESKALVNQQTDLSDSEREWLYFNMLFRIQRSILKLFIPSMVFVNSIPEFRKELEGIKPPLRHHIEADAEYLRDLKELLQDPRPPRYQREKLHEFLLNSSSKKIQKHATMLKAEGSVLSPPLSAFERAILTNFVPREQPFSTPERADSKAAEVEDARVEQFTARAYDVPVSLSHQLDSFLATLQLNKACKRALKALYKYVAFSILQQIQQGINQACRAKGQLLKGVLQNQREHPPSKSNAYYRATFQDSSKRGELSNYLVKNATLGQFQHLSSKFPQLRRMLADEPMSTIAPWIVCNYLDHRVRTRLSKYFHWKLSHVRPQLRGMRRLMEQSPELGSLLKLTTKNEEFSKLRAGVDRLLHSTPLPRGLQLDLLNKILNRFQAGHVLHLLLLSREKIYGLYPKLIKLTGRTYAAPEIEHQLRLFQHFCKRHRAPLEELVRQSLNGLIHIPAREVRTAIASAMREHDEHITFLKANKYGTYHATRKKKALTALQTTGTWWHYLECGVLPSERYIKALAKLVSALPKIRVKSEAALYSIVPVAYLTQLCSMRGRTVAELVKRFLAVFTADNCTTPPFTSPRNRKRCSPIDLTPLNHNFLIIRPETTANELLTKYLRQWHAIPLRIAPSEILTFYTGSATGRLDESTVKRFVRVLLTRKKYKKSDIHTILQLISFHGITSLSRKTFHQKKAELSYVARVLVDPVLEINLFTNKRLKGELNKVKAIIVNPAVELAPIRILPIPALKNSCTCQLIFKSQEVLPEFQPQIRCMKGVKIGKFQEKEIVGIDINQEDEHKVYIAPDWKTTAQDIEDALLEQQLQRRIYNEDKDKSFTAYVSNDSRSARVSKKINTLSGALKKDLSHLKIVKDMKKKVQGAFGRTKYNAIDLATKLYQEVVRVAAANRVQPEAQLLRATMTDIKAIPKHRVHALAQLRDQRNTKIQEVLALLEERRIPAVKQLRRQFEANAERGGKIHRQETELDHLQKQINNLRAEIDQKVKRLIAAILLEIHPGKLVYEALNVKHQGLKGVLGEITQYMPQMADLIAEAVELANLVAQSRGVSLQTEIYGVHPGGTSSPPHLPTGLDFERGGKNGWHEVTIPATVKDGVSHPQLKINSHILACQKLCEKVREPKPHFVRLRYGDG